MMRRTGFALVGIVLLVVAFPLFCVACAVASAPSRAQDRFPISPKGPVGSLAAITCPSAVVCYVTGSVAIPRSAREYGSAPGVLLKTTNAGSSWKRQVLPAVAGPLDGAWCWTVTHCIVVGDAVATRDSRTAGGLVLVTRNGGQSWKTLSRPVRGGGLGYLACPSSTMCVAVGATGPPPAADTILISHDKGSTWRSLPQVYISVLGFRDGTTLGNVACASARECIVADTWASSLLVGTEQGRHWKKVHLSRNLAPQRVACWSSRHCVLASTDTAGPSGPAHDLASTLSLPNGRITGRFRIPGDSLSVTCTGPERCLVAGSWKGDTRFLSAQTFDGGRHWTVTESPYVGYPLGVACLNAHHCIAVGTSGINGHEPAMLETNDFGATWVEVRVPNEGSQNSGN